MDSPIENLSDLSYIPQAPEAPVDFIGNNPTTSNLGSNFTGIPSFEKAPVDFIQAGIDKPVGVDEQMKYQPKTFDYAGSQADRYINDPNFQILDFNPNIGQENEYRYGAMQTSGQMWSNALAGSYRLGKQTFVEGWKGWGNMTDAVFSNWGRVGEGDFWKNVEQDLIGSQEDLLRLDKETNDIMNRYAIYQTPESEKSVWNRQLFGSMLQQSGFALGAAAQFLSEEILTAGLATGFGLAKLGLKTAMVGGKVTTAGNMMKDLLRMNSPWKLDGVMAGVYNSAKNTLRPAAAATEIGRAYMAGATATQIAKIGLGGTKRLFAEANMALTEAKMEAAGTYGEMYNRMVEDHINKTGQQPGGADLARIENMAKLGADQNFVVNAGVLAVMNRIQFDNLFTKFGLERRVLKEMGQYTDDVLKVTGKTLAKEGEEAAAKTLEKVYAKGQLGTLGVLGDVAKDFGYKQAAWQGAKAFGKNMSKWEVSEGVQELIQEGSNIAIQDYYKDLYEGNPANWDRSIAKAEEEQNPFTTKMGAQTFLMGAMTGRMISPIMGSVQKVQELATGLNKDVKDARERRKVDLESSVEMINKFFESPSKVLSEHVANIQIQNEAAKDMETALQNRDEYHYNNSKDSAFAKMVSAAKKTGMFEGMLDTIREYGNHFSDEQMKEAFPTVNPTENTVENAKKYFNRIADEIEGFHKSWEELQDQYGDRVMPELFAEGSEGRKQAEAAKMALDTAIEILATNKFKADRAGARLSDLYQKASSNKAVGNSSAQALRVLGNEDLMITELAMLEKEIEMLSNPGMKLDTEGKASLRSKKKELTRLKRWEQEWTKSEGKDRLAKRGFAKLKKAYAEYLEIRNEASKLDQPVTAQDIDQSWGFFLDHNELAKDNQDYIDAFNTLANPEAMVGLVNNGREAILNLVSQLKEQALANAKKEDAKNDEPEKVLDENGEEVLTAENKFGLTINQEEGGTWSVRDKDGKAVVSGLESEEEAIGELQMTADFMQELEDQKKADEEGEDGEQPEDLKSEDGIEEEPAAEGRELNIIPLKQEVIRMSTPKLEEGETLIYSEGGIFIIKSRQGLYAVVTAERKGFDPRKPDFYDQFAKEADAREEVADLLKKRKNTEGNRRKEYLFGGKRLRAGQVLIDTRDGKRYKVKSEGGPQNKKVNLKLLRNDLTETDLPVISVSPVDMANYEYDYKDTAVKKDGTKPVVQKWFRTNELSRIYPVKNSRDESDEAAQARLDKILLENSSEDLLKDMVLRVSLNSGSSKESVVLGNPSLKRVPEKVQMEVVFKGNVVGYITNGPSFRYYDRKNKMYSMSQLSLAQFKDIFDTKGKDVEREYKRFIEAAKDSENVHNAMLRLLTANKNIPIELSGENLASVINLKTNSGEFVFEVDRTRLSDLPYNTINGHVYVMDRQRRYKSKQTNEFGVTPGLSITSAIDEADVAQIEMEVAQVIAAADRDPAALLGRYVAVVKLPNGEIRFIELVTDTLDDAPLTALLSKMGEQSKLAKETNVKDTVGLDGKMMKGAVDPTFTELLNNEIAQTLFLSVSDRKGTYLDLGVSPAGNVYVKVNMRKDSAAGLVSRVVNISTPDFSSVDAFIKSVNEAIVKHDDNTTPKNQVEITLERKNFKESITRYPSASDIINMSTRVAPQMVKNGSLQVTSVAGVLPELVPTPEPVVQQAPAPEVVAADPISDEVYSNFVDKNQVPQEVLEAIAEKIKANGKFSERELAIFTGKTAEVNEILAKSNTAPVAPSAPEMSERDKAIAERKALIDEKKAFIKARRKELIGDGQNIFDADDAAQEEAAGKFDSRLDFLKDQINRVLKVTDRAVFDQAAVENLDKFKDWVKSVLPGFISVEEMDMIVDRLRGNAVTAGMFVSYMETLQDGSKSIKGKIKVGANAPFKYHEAFHAVFRLLLTDKRIDQLISVAKVEVTAKLRQQGKTLASAIAEMKTQHEIYDAMTEEELERRFMEEYMADEFEAYMMSPNKSTVAPGIKGFFQKLWDWIKSIFSKASRSELQGLFANIKAGKYRNANIERNQFTKETGLSVSEPAMKILRLGEKDVADENGRIITINENLSQSESDQLASTIASMYHVQALSLSRHNKDKVLDSILRKYASLYDLDNAAVRAFYSEKINEMYPDPDIENYDELTEAYMKRVQNYSNLFRDRDNRKAIKEAVNVHLEIMGYKQELEDDEFVEMTDEYGDRITTDNWKETHSIGGFGALSQFLRQYIAATTYEAADDFGNTMFLDGTPILKAVNANVVYNGLLKALSNNSSQRKMVQRMEQLRDIETETGKFVDKFFHDTGLVINEDGSFEVTNSTQATLFQAVIKGMQQYSVDYIFINKDINKRVARLSLANWNSAVKTQFSQWSNAYLEIYEKAQFALPNKEAQQAFAAERVKGVQQFIRLMDPKSAVDDAAVDKYAKEISRRIKLDLGMSLAPTYIKYSIAAGKESPTISQKAFLDAYDDVKPITIEMLTELEISLRNLENPFTKNIDTLDQELAQDDLSTDSETPGEAESENTVLDDLDFEYNTTYSNYDSSTADEKDSLGTGGIVSRINEIAKSNAVFDETVSTTSFKNAEGELVYTYQLPTFHLVKTTELNDEETFAKLSEDPYLENNILLNSPEFAALRGQIKVSRMEGMKQSILTESDGEYVEDKTIKSNQNKGVTYGSFGGREFLTALFDLYKYAKSHKREDGSTFMTTQALIRVMEASNTGDTVNLPVFSAVDSNGAITKLSTIALDRLYAGVEAEFNRIRRVNKEIKEIKAGKFKGDVLTGYHTKDKGKTERGLEFFHFKNALGPLAVKLQEIATGKAKLTDSRLDIYTALNEYFMKQVDATIEEMKNLQILELKEKKEDGTEVLTNRLIDDYISRGIETRGTDGKKGIDENKTSMLNLLPGNIRHNVAQVFINNFINVQAFNDILLGDQAMGLKDPVDIAKRARLSNASGASISTEITAPSLGINHTLQSVDFMIFTDPQYKAKYAGGNKDKADAQMYVTAKGMRYTLFGLSKLNKQLAEYLNKIEQGIPLTADEVFGTGGLEEIGGMFNSMKLVHADRTTVKTSAVMLTKELTSVKVDGKWVAIPGKEDLHDMRERMEAFEEKHNTVAFAGPRSLAKTLQKNVFDHKLGFNNAEDKNFTKQDANFWRLQLENPSNKKVITDPTQAKMLIMAEQDDNLEVDFMGVSMKMGDLKKMYLSDTDQRIKNNFKNAADEIFSIEGAYDEYSKSIAVERLTPKLEQFLKRAVETLRASGTDTQTIEFFTLDDNGSQVYNLNHPITLTKYTQLFLAYFSKGVMSEKIPGHSVALMSNYGVKVIKRFTGRRDENGDPIGEVIPNSEVTKNYAQYKNAKRWNNDQDRQFEELEAGDVYIDDLRHNVPEYNKKGEIIGRYSEFLMPPHFKEYMDILGMTDINEFLSKAFGVRIPSQDKHSFISLKQVDFLPAYYGSTAIFPHELIEISGADFDIDKLYMHIADTFIKNEQRIAYGTAKTANDKFEEYIAYLLDHNKEYKQAVRKVIIDNLNEQRAEFYDEKSAKYQALKDLPEIQRREVMKDYMIKYQKLDEATVNYFLGNLSDEFLERVNKAAIKERGRRFHNTVDSLEAMAEELSDGPDDVATAYKNLKKIKKAIQQSNRLRDERKARFKELDEKFEAEDESVGKLSLDTVDIEDLKAALISLDLPSDATTYAKATKAKELNNGVLNNRIMAAKLAMINNKSMSEAAEGETPVAFQVASTDPLKDLVKALKEEFKGTPIEAMLNEEISDIDSMLGQLTAYVNNKEGSRLIGPAVNSMLSFSFLSTHGVKFRTHYLNKMGQKEELFRLKVNGETFEGYNKLTTQEAERIFFVISTIVSAMTDNAKDRLAARFGLNLEAVGIMCNLVAQGMSLKSATMFILQPSVREYFEIRRNDSYTLGGGLRESKKNILRGIISKYSDPENTELPELTDELFKEGIRGNGGNKAAQRAVIISFAGIIDQTEYFSKVAKLIKTTKGVGTDMDSLQALIDNAESLGLNIDPKSSEFEDTMIPFDIRDALKEHKFLQTLVDIATKQIPAMSKVLFIERTKVFINIVDVIKSNLSVRNSVKTKFNKELNHDLISYLSIKAYRKMLMDKNRQGTLASMTNALIFDAAAEGKGDDFDDISDIVGMIRSKMPNNYLVRHFLNLIKTFRRDAKGNEVANEINRDGFIRLEANTWAKQSDYMLEKLSNSFIELYGSDADFDGKGANGRDMAMALFNYLLVKDGGQFRSNSFIRFIPNFMFRDILDATGLANDLMKLDSMVENDDKYKELFGVTADDLINEFMMGYTTHKGNEPYIKVINADAKTEVKLNNKAADAFDPKSFQIRKNSIKISLFGGIRKSSTQLEGEALEAAYNAAGIEPYTWVDSEGITRTEYPELLQPMDELESIEYIAEQVEAGTYNANKRKKGPYSEDEIMMLVKNKIDLQKKGFFVNKEDGISFPYIIKTREYDEINKGIVRKTYILKAVNRAGKSKAGEGANITSLLSAQDLDNGKFRITGTEAVYVPFEAKGSKKTFKAGFVFDEIPALAKRARKRSVSNYNPEWSTDGYYEQMAENKPLSPAEQAHYSAIEAGIIPEGTPYVPNTPITRSDKRTTKDVLEVDYGIMMSLSKGVFTFSGPMYDALKKRTGKNYTNPADVLAAVQAPTAASTTPQKESPLEDECAQPVKAPVAKATKNPTKADSDDFFNPVTKAGIKRTDAERDAFFGSGSVKGNL